MRHTKGEAGTEVGASHDPDRKGNVSKREEETAPSRTV